MWTQTPFQLCNYVSWQALVEEKHLVIVEAEWFSGLKTKESLQSIREYFTFCEAICRFSDFLFMHCINAVRFHCQLELII